MRGAIDWHGLSDKGRVRETNEDQFLIAGLHRSLLIHQTSLNHEAHTRLFGGSQGHLLAVADGLGGQVGGRRASTLAMDTLTRYVLRTTSWFFSLHNEREDDLIDDLAAALERCNKTIEQAAAGSGPEEMGTTLTMAYVVWPRLYVVHAGDSRCYLRRGGRLEQITRDHTMAQRFVESGELTAEEAKTSRWSHVLWNCLGGGGATRLEPEVYKTTLQLGDTLLLCTDGLTKGVQDAQILEFLRRDQSARHTCEQLVRAANEAGGRDNITVIVVSFRETAQAQHAQAETARAVHKEGVGWAEPAPIR
jgi:serine/threonine protein phosphatase PrpC